MSDLTPIATSKAAPAAGPYSQAIKTSTGLIFTSGQLPAEASGAIDTNADASVQTERCIKNIEAILEGAGSSIGRVVKTTVFLTDMGDFSAVNAVYEQHFVHKPARSCFAVKELPKGARVEIECVALA